MTAYRWSKFWWADWQNDNALKVCSYAARGLWMGMLAIMHEANPRGHLLVNGRSLTPARIASLTNGSEREVKKLLEELEGEGVFSRREDGVIYSRRMVNDTRKSEEGRDFGATGGNPNLKPKPKPSPNGPHNPNGEGRGLTPPVNREQNPTPKPLEAEAEVQRQNQNSSSLREEAAPRAAASEIETGCDLLGLPPARPCARTALFREGLQKLIAMSGRTERSLRAWLGSRVLPAVEDDAGLILSLIQDAHRRWMSQDQELADPVSWIVGQVKIRVDAMKEGRVVRLNPSHKAQADTPGAMPTSGTAAWHRKQAEERAARARAKANGAHGDHPNVIDGESEPVEAQA